MIFLTTLAVFSSCGGGDGGGRAAWTVLVYLAADNNLSDAALVDLAEMEAVGSVNGIKVAVQIDRKGEGARRLLINKGSASVLKELGEVNMADPDTLMEFIEWGIGKFPAEQTALLLWSHGDGYQKPILTPNTRPLPSGILQDDTDGVSCCLSNVSVRSAIEGAAAHFDLLGFDASQMGQVETAYEFNDLANILVFSQETGQENGWDYTGILNGLTEIPDMSSEELSSLIVQTYGDFYEKVFYPGNPGFTPNKQTYNISAVRLGDSINSLVSGVDDFSIVMKTALDSPTTRKDTLTSVGEARDAAQGMVNITLCPDYVDLFDFIDRLIAEPDLDPDILQAATSLSDMKDDVLISEYHGQARPGAKGLSILFYPEAQGNCSNFDTDYLDGSSPIAFVSDTDWNEFLSAYYFYQGLTP